MVKLLSAVARPEYRLFLIYDDGATGLVDLSHLVGKGVFELWQEPGRFESLSVGSHGAVRWSDEVELCGDALYLQLTGKPVEALFPVLKITAHA